MGTNEALYRGVLLDVATYSAVWEEKYNESFDSDCVFYADSLEELFDRMSRGNLEKKLGYAAVWTQNWIPGDTYEDINIPAEFRGVLFLETDTKTPAILMKPSTVFILFSTPKTIPMKKRCW